VKTFALIFVVCLSFLGFAGCGGDDAGPSTIAEEKPKPEVPQGPPSEELAVTDLVEGTGAVAGAGDKVSVHYVAGIYETGEEIESAWVKGDPFGFRLGAGDVLDGWEEGLPGMRVGGRRQLLVPTSPDVIPIGSELGDTLVYVIDLIELREDVEEEEKTTAENGPPAKPPGPVTTQTAAEAAKRPEPTVAVSLSRPPRKLAVRDLIRGAGRAAQKGDELAVHFTGVRFNGEFFESIWDKPFTFELDSADVNPGWVMGLPGMRAGGRRELVVPTHLTSSYGISPSEDDPQNALIYVVDLLDVKPGNRRQRTEPTVSVPAGAPPPKLVVEDRIAGTGAAAAPGDVLTVEYVSVYWDGRAFSNSWDREEPFSFELGSGTYAVNPGWEKGLVGMRVGGRRELIVPPRFQQQGGALPGGKPEDTLVYVIDLVAVDQR